VTDSTRKASSQWIRPIIITLIGVFAGAILQYYFGPNQPRPPINITIHDFRGAKLDEIPVQISRYEKNVSIELSRTVIDNIIRDQETLATKSPKNPIERNHVTVTAKHPDQELHVPVTSKHPDQAVQVPVTSKNPAQ
jgi:hypothetical protein